VISARVENSAPITAYKYAAFIGGVKKDPDLIIDP
jgi:hypothetical protein